MKFTPEVIAALQVLRDNAENDFERHRINVLERDLIKPPVVEQIDETHQKFLGFTYRTEPKGHFVRNQFIHRDVWQYYCGDIPAGDYEIHHIDHNKANNDISNLQLLTRTEHGKLHTGHLRNPDKKCPTCGKIFHPRYSKQKYCSMSCYKGYQTKQDYERICPCCGKVFKARHNYNVYCSVSCATKARTKNYVEKTCPFCGKNFSTNFPAQVCCSVSCAVKLRCQKEKAKQNASISLFETT